MNKIFTILATVLLSASLCAQAPQSFSYQAVVRGAKNELLVNKPVGMRLSLLQGSEKGKAVYEETQFVNTNENGLVSIAIGAGNKLIGDFISIDWSKGPYFLKTETDLTGGTSYTLIATSQLLSVPFALYAANSQPGPKGDKGDQGIPGKDGLDGKNGVDGKDGATGPIGPKGDTGAVGPQGISGKDGLQGPIGLTGAAGKDGVDGKNGMDGKGEVGPQGPKGDTPEVKVTVSSQGDTLRFENGSYVIIPGISAANPKSKPTNGYGTNISDVDGNSYKTVYIGTQQWIGENLKVSKYNDGTEIPNVTGNTQWGKLTTGSWAYYNNSDSLGKIYGKLYNWYAVSPTTNGNKNVCPTGWHVPTDAEWTVLTDYLGGSSVAGGKLKEVGTSNWHSLNTDATNTTLFSALPGGLRYGSGGYCYGVGDFGYWWSSSEYDMTNAWIRDLKGSNGIITRSLGDKGKRSGYSVRCLKD